MTTLRLCALLLALAPLAGPVWAAAPDAGADFRARRMALVRAIEVHGVRDSATLDAMRRVPRHEFVLPHDRDQAYGDPPLAARKRGHGPRRQQPRVLAAQEVDCRPWPPRPLVRTQPAPHLW